MTDVRRGPFGRQLLSALLWQRLKSFRMLASLGLCFGFLMPLPGQAKLFDKPLDRLIAALEKAERDIGTTSSTWQNLLPKLGEQFSQSEKQTIADSLSRVQGIVNQGTQLLAEQGKCTVDFVAKDVKLQVDNLIHSLKKDGKEQPPSPIVCAITPPSIDMANVTPIMHVSGAWFTAANEPSLYIENSAHVKQLVPASYLSLSTAYAMDVRLDLLEQAHLIGKDTRRLQVTFNGQPGLGLVEVVALNTCFDGIRNQDESDVDCGGTCGRCAAKQRCTADSDCASSTCLAHVCGIHKLGSAGANLDFGGGTLGKKPWDISCPLGSVATGFWANTGEAFNQLALICQNVLPNGALDPTQFRTVSRGGTAAAPSLLSAHCEPGAALIGFQGHTGALINEMIGKCASPYDVARWNAEGTSAPKESSTVSVKAHPEGNDVNNACPQGAVVSGLHLDTGFFIDHVSFRCTMISRVVAQ
jgi:hypothetical protein